MTLEEENRRLKECAYKYLSWLNVRNPVKGLKEDLNDLEMIKPLKSG